jgi:uncharacterized iron-regulated protein
MHYPIQQSYLLLSSLVLTFLLSSCSGQRAIKPRVLDQSQIPILQQYQKQLPSHIITAQGTLSFIELLTQLNDSQVIFVGEVHDRYDHHLSQLQLLQALHRTNPQIAIGVEWFQQPYQWVLNRYLNGSFNEAQLLERSEYYQRWQYPYALLRPILQYAKQHKIPIIALNAPVEITRKIGKSGLASLTKGERQQLAKLIPPASTEYYKKLTAIFSQHSANKKLLENFVMVQRVWDSTMAMNIDHFLQKRPTHKMLVFAGQGHMQRGMGIPTDLQHQSQLKFSIVTSGEESEYKSTESNYFIVTQALTLSPAGRLGVLLTTLSNGVAITRVSKGSAAERAGLQKGDRFIQIADINIHDIGDIKRVLADKQPNEKVWITVLRNGFKQHIALILQ